MGITRQEATRIRQLLCHADPKIQAQGRELLAALGVPDGLQRVLGGAKLLRRAGLAGLDLAALDLSGVDMRGADLRGAKLAGAALTGTNLDGADLRGADLRGARFARCRLEDADLRGARVAGAAWKDCRLNRADLSDIDLREATIDDCYQSQMRLQGADLRGKSLRGAYLGQLDLRRADLRGADLREADFRFSDLREVKLQGAQLEGARIVAASLAGTDLGGVMLRGIKRLDADLSKAIVEDVDLSERISEDLRATEATLRRVALHGMHRGSVGSRLRYDLMIHKATLEECDLSDLLCGRIYGGGAQLRAVSFREASIESAYFAGASLVDVDLKDARIQKLDLTGARLEGVDLSAAAIEEIVGLSDRARSQLGLPVPAPQRTPAKKVDYNLIFSFTQNLQRWREAQDRVGGPREARAQRSAISLVEACLFDVLLGEDPARFLPALGPATADGISNHTAYATFAGRLYIAIAHALLGQPFESAAANALDAAEEAWRQGTPDPAALAAMGLAAEALAGTPAGWRERLLQQRGHHKDADYGASNASVELGLLAAAGASSPADLALEVVAAAAAQYRGHQHTSLAAAVLILARPEPGAIHRALGAVEAALWPAGPDRSPIANSAPLAWSFSRGRLRARLALTGEIASAALPGLLYPLGEVPRTLARMLAGEYPRSKLASSAPRGPLAGAIRAMGDEPVRVQLVIPAGVALAEPDLAPHRRRIALAAEWVGLPLALEAVPEGSR